MVFKYVTLVLGVQKYGDMIMLNAINLLSLPQRPDLKVFLIVFDWALAVPGPCWKIPVL
jgi:hypothetical protein